LTGWHRREHNDGHGISQRSVAAFMTRTSVPATLRLGTNIPARLGVGDVRYVQAQKIACSPVGRSRYTGLKFTCTRVIALDWKIFGISHHLHDIKRGCRCNGYRRRSGANRVRAPDGEGSNHHGTSDDSDLAHRPLLAGSVSSLVLPELHQHATQYCRTQASAAFIPERRRR
jgi:hypothetical protein